MSRLSKEIFDEFTTSLCSSTDYQKLETYIWHAISTLPLIERKVVVSKYYPRMHGVEYLTDKIIGRILHLFQYETKSILNKAVWKIKVYIRDCINRGEL